MSPHHTRMHLPEDDYLLAVGQVAYMVASLEGLVVFDLPGLSNHIPHTMTAGSLAGKTTGQIAKALLEAAPEITDRHVRRYIEVAGGHLAEASSRRNDLLHARPATLNGQTRLYRWKLEDGRGPHLAFPITVQWLKETVEVLSAASEELNGCRPLHKHTAFTENQS